MHLYEGNQTKASIKKYKRSLSNFIIRNIKFYWGDKLEKNEMGGACSMYGGKERCI
jgi:hypothetical protein